jgi:hypothetical protein
VFADEEVDGYVEEGEEASEGGGHAFHSLDGFLVVGHAGFELVEAAGLADAQNLAHLAFEYAEVGEDLSFEVCHWFLLLWLLADG